MAKKPSKFEVLPGDFKPVTLEQARANAEKRQQELLAYIEKKKNEESRLDEDDQE